MQPGGPTIMWRFSITRHADKRKQNTGMDLFDAVLNAHWYTIHGGLVVSITERWKTVQPNMWLATSQKSSRGVKTHDFTDDIQNSLDSRIDPA